MTCLKHLLIISVDSTVNTIVIIVYECEWHHCIVLYLSIYIAPLNSHGQTEALLVGLASRTETSFKK